MTVRIALTIGMLFSVTTSIWAAPPDIRYRPYAGYPSRFGYSYGYNSFNYGGFGYYNDLFFHGPRFQPNYPPFRYISPEALADYDRKTAEFDAKYGPQYPYHHRLHQVPEELPLPTEQHSSAKIRVTVPTEDTSILIQGQETAQRGQRRTFQSPKLHPARIYRYKITARWIEAGLEQSEERIVHIQAGATVRVDFTRDQDSPNVSDALGF